MIDYYEILGVERTATLKEIRKAYIRQCKRWHPDRINAKSDPQGWSRANARFQLINEAHKTLKEPLARRQYDEQWLGREPGSKSRTQQADPPNQKSNTATNTPPYVRSSQPHNDLQRRPDVAVGDYLRSLGLGKGGFWKNYYYSLTLDNRIALAMMVVMLLYVLWKIVAG